MTNLKYEAWMNGRALSDVSPLLYVTAIRYTPPKKSADTTEVIGRYGESAGAVKYKSTMAAVSFIMKKTDGWQRQQVIQAVADWGRQGLLEISDRPGQQLHVVCSNPPYVEDGCDWTKPYTIEFQTLEHPFWEAQTPARWTGSGTSGEGTLFVPGNIGMAVVEAVVTPVSSAANITLTAGDTSITLTGVSATSSQPVRIYYDERGIQYIMCGTTSVLSKRTGSDDLLAECGRISTVSFSASASVSVTLSARGLWV